MYNIKLGKLHTPALLARFGTPQGATNLEIVLLFGRPSVELGTFMTARLVPQSAVHIRPSQPDPANDSEEEVEDGDRVHFACPKYACIKV